MHIRGQKERKAAVHDRLGPKPKGLPGSGGNVVIRVIRIKTDNAQLKMISQWVRSRSKRGWSFGTVKRTSLVAGDVTGGGGTATTTKT